MKNIVLVAAIIGASSCGFAFADNLGELHGYAQPFQKSEIANNSGQHADAGQFGRNSGYGDSINQAYEVSKGTYANVGNFGRLSGYGDTTLVTEASIIASH